MSVQYRSCFSFWSSLHSQSVSQSVTWSVLSQRRSSQIGQTQAFVCSFTLSLSLDLGRWSSFSSSTRAIERRVQTHSLLTIHWTGEPFVLNGLRSYNLFSLKTALFVSGNEVCCIQTVTLINPSTIISLLFSSSLFHLLFWMWRRWLTVGLNVGFQSFLISLCHHTIPSQHLYFVYFCIQFSYL